MYNVLVNFLMNTNGSFDGHNKQSTPVVFLVLDRKQVKKGSKKAGVSISYQFPGWGDFSPWDSHHTKTFKASQAYRVK